MDFCRDAYIKFLSNKNHFLKFHKCKSISWRLNENPFCIYSVINKYFPARQNNDLAWL